MVKLLKQNTTAAVGNSIVKLRFTSHYYCTTGECGKTLAAMLGAQDKRRARKQIQKGIECV